MGCRDLIVLEDGRAIDQPKDLCSTKIDAKDVNRKIDEVVDGITETIRVKGDSPLFKEVTVGQELIV